MGWGQILTLKNDPTCNFAPRIVTIYKLYWDGVGSNFNVEKWPQTLLGWGRGQILTLKNDPSLISALRVVMKYKLHWNGVG